MPRRSKAQEHTRKRLAELAARSLAPARLAQEVVAALQASIGWDGYRLFGLDGATCLVNRLLAASENDGGARLEWLREVYLAMPTPYVELPLLARAGTRAVAFQERQEQCWGYRPDHLARVAPDDHYRWFHEYRSPVGGTLLAIFRDGERPVAALQAYRRDPQRPFRASDVAFLQSLSTLVGESLASAIARETALATYPAGDAPASGILLVEAAGAVRFATPAAERWLDALGEREGGLPTPVWASLAALRGMEEGRAAVVTVPTAGGQVRIEASPGGEPGLAAIVVAPVAPPAPPEIPARWGLTPQEQAVVTELARGKSNARIAEALFVSAHTVEWHLRSVYGKLGVGSRQEVLAALFHQAFLPPVETDLLRPAS